MGMHSAKANAEFVGHESCHQAARLCQRGFMVQEVMARIRGKC